ncbi:MAG: DsbA family protein [Alphaproteobacteria bacterium]|nr:DsbA family protein [Alphaproteobacteria bacterium]
MRYAAVMLAFALGLALAGLGFFMLRPTVDGPLSALRSSEIEAIVTSYLKEHPDVVIDAIRTYQQREKATQESEQERLLKERWDELARDPRDPVVGNLAGDVTLIEYFDYRCPFCKRATPTLMQLVTDDPRLRVVLKEYPILGKDSVTAAKVALAAHRQGRYAAFHNALMDEPGQIDEARSFAVAARLGLDIERLKRDMVSPEIERHLRDTYEAARELGITGTPAFVVAGKIIPGAVDIATLKRLVAQARRPTG